MTNANPTAPPLETDVREVFSILQENLTEEGLWQLVGPVHNSKPVAMSPEDLEALGKKISSAHLDLPKKSKRSRPSHPRTTMSLLTMDVPSTTYWQRLKTEFHKFVCTNDKKYQNAKNDLAKHAGKGQVIIVSTIASAISSVLGVAAGSLVPLVAICLVAMLSIGKGAYCAG